MDPQLLSSAFGPDAAQLTADEKQLLLSRLLSRLAHEIRNPLSSLDIHFQLLEEDLVAAGGELRDRVTPRFEIIRGELNRLENLVRNFLRLAAPSAVEAEEVDLSQLIRRVSDLVFPEGASRGIEMLICLPETVKIMADPGQLTQALLNLLVNAVQAVGQSGRVEVAAFPLDDGQMQIDVADSGPGVPYEHQRAIFEPYFTTKPEGSGLGLWIAQQIAMAHGGTIRVANRPAGGAVFSLLLPWVPNPA